MGQNPGRPLHSIAGRELQIRCRAARFGHGDYLTNASYLRRCGRFFFFGRFLFPFRSVSPKLYEHSLGEFDKLLAGFVHVLTVQARVSLVKLDEAITGFLKLPELCQLLRLQIIKQIRNLGLMISRAAEFAAKPTLIGYRYESCDLKFDPGLVNILVSQLMQSSC